MTPEEIVKAQAEYLGGGWRRELDNPPFVVLTIEEAQTVIDKMKKKPTALFVSDALMTAITRKPPVCIEVEFEGIPIRLAWEDVSFVFEADD